MPTSAELLAEITSDPQARGYSVPYAAGNDTAVAGLLNAKVFRGLVPLRELSSLCLALNVTNTVKALIEIPIGGTISAGVTMDIPTKAGLYKILTLIETDFRLELADADDPGFSAGCDGLIAMGFLDSAGKTALLALGNNRRSRAEVLWGDGVTIRESDIGETRKVGA